MRRRVRAAFFLVLFLAAAAAAAPSQRDPFLEAKKALETAIQTFDDASARAALAAIARDGSERAVKLLAATAAAGRDLDIYRDLVLAVSATARASDPALKEVLRTAAKHPDWTVRFLFVEALLGIDRPDARETFCGAFEDKHESVATHAVRIACAAHEKWVVRPLIDLCERLEKKKDAGRTLPEAQRALAKLTGGSFTAAGDWRRWWDANERTIDLAKIAAKGKSGEDATTVVRRVEERGEYQFLEQVQKGDIFVVKGRLDACEEVLDALKLPHTDWHRDEAKKKLPALDPKAVLVYNCNYNPADALRGDDARALASFVERGGYLFTSDWGLTEEVVPAMSGFIMPGPVTPGRKWEVKIAPSRANAGHPYLRDVFPENPYDAARMKWQMDGGCCGLKLTSQALALIESPELGKLGAPVMAGTFRFGKGSVLHVIGHFREQRDGSSDGFALQQMLVNFIVEKQKFRKRSPSGKPPKR